MKINTSLLCAACLVPMLVSAQDEPVKTRINKVKLGASLSFSYNKPIFKGIDTTTGYRLVPRINLGPTVKDKNGVSVGAVNAYKGPLKFVLRPRFGVLNQGYDASDSSLLNGMRDRSRSFTVGLKLRTRTPLGTFIASGGYDVTGNSDGFESSLMYTTLLPLGSSKLRLYPEIGVDYWSKKVSDYYFGVNADETMFNNIVVRDQYSLTDNSTNYFLGYSAEYPINKHWALTHSLRKTWYDDQILDSPVVDDDKASELRVLFGLTYDF